MQRLSHHRRLPGAFLAFFIFACVWLLGGEPSGLAGAPEAPLHLRSGSFDPQAGGSLAGGQVQADQLGQAVSAGPGLRLVQFPGPIQTAWRTALDAAGLQVVAYIPDNAYLVWGDINQLAQLSKAAPLRWAGDYLPEYALHPRLAQIASNALPDANPQAPVDVNVQLVDRPEIASTLETIQKESLDVLVPVHSVAGTQVLSVRLGADRLTWLAGLAGVVNVEPRPGMHKNDEIQGQIIAGALDASGTQPSGPGYVAWLASLGFSTNPLDYPIVDVTDDGIDDGTSTPQHPDFYFLGDPSSLIDRLAYNVDWTVDPMADGRAGHGNLNASIVAGYNQRSGPAYEDANGFNYGLGISPFGLVAGSKVFNNAGNWDLPGDNYSALLAQTYSLGGRISSNSWGSDSNGAYTIDDQAYDALVRDAQQSQPGSQPMILVFSAGNNGSAPSTTGSPGNAKNVITVGASESVRPDWTDGCNVGADGADNAQQIAEFSGRGPTQDGRIKPDLVAPGTHITGAASQVAGYSGAGVCDRYHPDNQTLYAASSGTSHSAPAVAGAASLLYRYYSVHFGGQPPSPAMTKAYLVNAARYLTGESGDVLPSPSQGFGGLDLGRAFDGQPRILVDQNQVLGATGEVYTLRARVASSSRPVRITLAWTDAPGATTGDAYVNNLDLEASLAGQTYLGNVFQGEFSKLGGTPDAHNNLESIFLPAGQSGDLTIRVRATNLPGDGVPGNANLTDQDFALVVYNGLEITGKLKGTVQNSVSGAAVPEAILQTHLSSPTGERTFRTQADASGVYTLPLPAGTYAVSAWKYGYIRSDVAGLVITDDQTLPQNFLLAPAQSYHLGGCVADQNTGQGLAASLKFQGPFGDPVTDLATTQAQPCYGLDLPAGSYQVQVESRLHQSAQEQVEVSGNQIHNFTLVATTNQGLLSGSIVSQKNGARLYNAYLDARSADGQTNAHLYTSQDGLYETLLSPGSYTITASAPFYTPLTLTEVTIPQSNLARADFELPSATLAVTPTGSLALHVMPGEALTQTLTIKNLGLGVLDFSVYAVTQTLKPAKTDTYGYSLLDSRTSPGVLYNWLDLTSAPQVLLLDDGEANLTLPFPFTFYGRTSTSLRVGNNGAVLFGTETGEVLYNNTPLDTADQDYLIAPFWDDLDSSTGWVAYQTIGEPPNRQFVVLWYMRPHFSKVGNVTLQMILYEATGNIKFQYQDVDFGKSTFDLGASATIGIRGNGPYFLEASYNQPSLANGVALCFQAPSAPPCDPPDIPWLSFVSASGHVANGQDQAVSVVIDGAGLSNGRYLAQLQIASNDPDRQPVQGIAVSLVVGEVHLYYPLISK